MLVASSSSTCYVDWSRKSRVQRCRRRLLVDCFRFHRAVIPKSRTLLRFSFVVNAVLIRNSMALRHLSSERHRQHFVSSSIDETSIFLTSFNYLLTSNPNSYPTLTRSSSICSKQRKGSFWGLPFRESFLFKAIANLLKCVRPKFSCLMISRGANQISTWRKKRHSNSQSAPSFTHTLIMW